MSDQHGGESDALERIVAEAREEGPPEIDWAGFETRLGEAIDERREPRCAPAGARRSRFYVAFAAAAAMLVGVGAYWQLSRSTHSVAVVGVEQPAEVGPVHGVSAVDGESLEAGDRVTARGDEVRVEHAGRVTWTLSPGSAARVVVAGELLTVELTSGRILAEVVPDPRIETFAVEVGDTRVAVRGTVFSVELRGERAHVDVTKGTVAVGDRANRGATTGWLLNAPARGDFSLDGAEDGEVQRSEPSPPAGDTASPPRSTPPVAARKAATASEQPEVVAERPASTLLPNAPTSDDLRATADFIVDGVQRCFSERTASAKGTTIRARSKIKIDIAPDGGVTTVRFDPPLAPAVQRCAARVLENVRAPASEAGGSVERTIDLGE